MAKDYGLDTEFLEDKNTLETSKEYKPSDTDYNTFQLRTDPTNLITEMELRLKNQFIDKQGNRQQIKNTKPLLNEEGVQTCLNMLRSIINNHTVQNFTKDLNDFKNRMQFISDDITVSVWINRKNWDLELHNTNLIINNMINMADLFLTRGIDNSERLLYSEGFKETTSREVKPSTKPRNAFEKFSDKLFGV